MSGAWHAMASAMPYAVDEQLFQHQVQFKFGVVTQGICGAKFIHPGGQPLEFAKVSVQ
jgi:hypothetical protein